MVNQKDYCRSLPSPCDAEAPCDAEDCVSFPYTSSSKNSTKVSIHSTASATTGGGEAVERADNAGVDLEVESAD
ncbi:hypothetical protein E2562_028160 [Oryza meyeriana var. granulata]|uniref:Uncharacterized protein n=1 Tax=Oryza meyeriana var. granulata TaxID=110450 RepID=A0A6G1D9A2_9ORYZ|nr:hypothetical protein E2562_028160 [Oryza meyeriana var. granulata]